MREGDVQISDILRNNVKEKLARDEVVASMTVRLVRDIDIARIARTAGFDTLYVDLEHSSFSLETTGQICMAALEVGIAPFVRVPANTPDYIARVLEGGALGVIAPHVRSADEARAVVRAAKFRAARRALERQRPAASALPLVPDRGGLRGAKRRHHGHRAIRKRGRARRRPRRSSRSRASTWCWSASTTCWPTGAFPGSTIIRVCARPMRTIIAACRKHGKHCGVGGLATRPDLVAEFVRMGARYVSTGTDLAFC